MLLSPCSFIGGSGQLFFQLWRLCFWLWPLSEHLLARIFAINRPFSWCMHEIYHFHLKLFRGLETLSHTRSAAGIEDLLLSRVELHVRVLVELLPANPTVWWVNVRRL